VRGGGWRSRGEVKVRGVEGESREKGRIGDGQGERVEGLGGARRGRSWGRLADYRSLCGRVEVKRLQKVGGGVGRGGWREQRKVARGKRGIVGREVWGGGGRGYE